MEEDICPYCGMPRRPYSELAFDCGTEMSLEYHVYEHERTPACREIATLRERIEALEAEVRRLEKQSAEIAEAALDLTHTALKLGKEG